MVDTVMTMMSSDVCYQWRAEKPGSTYLLLQAAMARISQRSNGMIAASQQCNDRNEHYRQHHKYYINRTKFDLSLQSMIYEKNIYVLKSVIM